MSNATHYNQISNAHYMVKPCGVYMWHNEMWRMSAFKEYEVTPDNGFTAI